MGEEPHSKNSPMHEALAIFKNLSKIVVEINQDCRFCSGAIEDLEHLFLHCPVAVAVFFGFQMSCRTEACVGKSIKEVTESWLKEKGNS